MRRVRNRVSVFLQLLRRDVRLLAKRAVTEFVNDRCTQMASSISYWVFFSIFPMLIFLVTVLGQLLRNEGLRNRVIDTVLNSLPDVFDQSQARDVIEDVLRGVSTDFSLLGLVSIIGLLWGASAMMTSIRVSINVVWKHGYRRPALRGKLVDMLMVLGVGLLLLLSLAGTALFRTGVEITERISFIPLDWAWGLLGWVLPFIVSFTIFTLVYRFVPVVPVRLRDIWPGALVAALAFEIAKQGFTFYVANFANYNAIYGSLGAVVVFLVFVYLAANILLFGAEIASEWPRVRAGHYAPVDDDEDDDRSTLQRIRELVSSLIFLDTEEQQSNTRPPGELPDEQAKRPS